MRLEMLSEKIIMLLSIKNPLENVAEHYAYLA